MAGLSNYSRQQLALWLFRNTDMAQRARVKSAAAAMPASPARPARLGLVPGRSSTPRPVVPLITPR
jgi:hypothetical protein